MMRGNRIKSLREKFTSQRLSVLLFLIVFPLNLYPKEQLHYSWDFSESIKSVSVSVIQNSIDSRNIPQDTFLAN